MEYGGDISVPSLKRVRIKSLPKAQTEGSIEGKSGFDQLTPAQIELLKKGNNYDTVKSWYENDYVPASSWTNPDGSTMSRPAYNAMEDFIFWINQYDAQNYLNQLDPSGEEASMFNEALKNNRDWYKQWYTKRQQLPQFKDVAQKRLAIKDEQMSSTLKDPINLSIDWWKTHEGLEGKNGIPEVFYAPEIGGITRGTNADYNIDFGGTDDVAPKLLQRKYYRDANGKLQNSLITHEESHIRDKAVPQAGTKHTVPRNEWGENEFMDPIETIISKKDAMADPRNIGYPGIYQQAPTEVRARLNNWRMINNIDALKYYTPDELKLIIDKNLQDPNLDNDIKELYETIGNNPEYLKFLHDSYVSNDGDQNLDGILRGKQGGSMKKVKIKTLPKAQTEGQFNTSYDVSKSLAENMELNRRAKVAGWNSVDEYEKSGWAYKQAVENANNLEKGEEIANWMDANYKQPSKEVLEQEKKERFAKHLTTPSQEDLESVNSETGYAKAAYTSRFGTGPKVGGMSLWSPEDIANSEINDADITNYLNASYNKQKIADEVGQLTFDIAFSKDEKEKKKLNSELKDKKYSLDQADKVVNSTEFSRKFSDYQQHKQDSQQKANMLGTTNTTVGPLDAAVGLYAAAPAIASTLGLELLGTGVTLGNVVNPAFHAVGTYNFLNPDSDFRQAVSRYNAGEGDWREIAFEGGLNALNFLGAGSLPGDIAAFRNARAPQLYKYNPWAWKPNPNAYYHRSPNLENIINQETGTLQGFGQSEAGKLFTEAAAGSGKGINLKRGANNQLYFSKGVPMDYGRYNTVEAVGQTAGQGYKGPYIAEVEGVPMGSSVKGRAPGLEPTKPGSYAASKRPISLDEAKFYKEHWLYGYKPVEIPKVLPGSPNSAQYQIRGLAGTSTKTGLTEENVAAAIEREKQWIQSDEYVKRRAANTGETVEQIKADVAKILSTAEDARFNLNANITAQGQMTPKSLFQRTPTVEIAKHSHNPINTLEHETGHLYSPVIHGQSDAALHKGMLEADVANLPASERGVYANYPTLGEGFDKTANTIDLGAKENYLNLGHEQQVRHLNARDQILKANNLPMDAQLTEAEVKPFVDTWAERMNKLTKDPQNPDLLKGEMDYDELWLQEAWKIRENLLKEYGVAADSELTAAQMKDYRIRTKEELAKAITDVLNKAWIAVPAIGVGAAMQQKKKGGAINAISKYKNKFADRVNNNLPKAQTMGQFNSSYDFNKSPFENAELNRRAQAMGWNSVAEYEASGWGQNELALKQRALINNPQVQQMAKIAAEMRPELANANVQARQDQLYADNASSAQKTLNQVYYSLSNPLDALGQYSKYGYVPQGNVGNYGFKDDSAGPISLANATFNPFAWGNAAYRFANEVDNADSWTTGTGAVNMTTDFLEALPFFSEVSKAAQPALRFAANTELNLVDNAINTATNAYNKVATGNSFIPRAWKVERPNFPIKSTDYIARPNTDAEIALLDKFGRGMKNLTSEEWVGMENLTRSGATDFSQGDYPISRILGYYDRGSAENKLLEGLKVGDVFHTPTEKTIRTWSVGTPGKGDLSPFGNTRLVIPSKYTKGLGNNFGAMPYNDKRLPFIWNPETGEINSMAVAEKEIMGNIPKGFKVIGSSNENGLRNLIIKPLKKNGGSKKKEAGFQILTDANGKYVFVKT